MASVRSYRTLGPPTSHVFAIALVADAENWEIVDFWYKTGRGKVEIDLLGEYLAYDACVVHRLLARVCLPFRY